MEKAKLGVEKLKEGLCLREKQECRNRDRVNLSKLEKWRSVCPHKASARGEAYKLGAKYGNCSILIESDLMYRKVSVMDVKKIWDGVMIVQCNHHRSFMAHCNPNSSDIEFRLEPLSFKHYGNGFDSNQPSKEQIIGDLKFLFAPPWNHDLKTEAKRTFQEVYAMFKRFEADEFLDFGSLEGSINLKFLVGQSGSVRIKGTSPSKHAPNHF
ncbi:hypothetical protein NC651_040079 [Populus alba x Populus x berolinensis]|nr:hypothetical protein NC651_040079 [Populus alba x Populus x berolinensis]